MTFSWTLAAALSVAAIIAVMIAIAVVRRALGALKWMALGCAVVGLLGLASGIAVGSLAAR